MSEIKCPSCGHEFTLSDVMTDEMNTALKKEKEKLNEKWAVLTKQKDAEMNEKLAQLVKAQKENEVAIKEKAEAEVAAKLQVLQEEAKEKAEKLKTLEKKELDLLRANQVLEDKQQLMEIEIEKRVYESKKQLQEDVERLNQEKMQLLLKEKDEEQERKMKEKDLQVESMRKNIEELKRKVEQGSMQAQGEAQELLLEQLLHENFPVDNIAEVGKGVEGADCIQHIITKTGQNCGSIIFESKNAKHWKNEWIEKLKNDKRSKKAEVAVLVTQVFPKNMTKFGEIDGVWVCNYTEVIPLVHVLRQGVVDVYHAQKSQENKGDKMNMMYDYLTSSEFRDQINAIVEGFMAMKGSIDKERATMEKHWSEREKQIKKVILNISSMHGSMRGIAGSSISDIPLLDG
jgi:hypothetical protein